MPEITTTSIRVPTDLLQILRDRAKRNRRPISSELQVLLEAALCPELHEANTTGAGA